MSSVRLLGVLQTVESVLRRKSCEKLVKYQARSIEFKGLSADAGKVVNVNLGSLNTDVKVLQNASETAQAIDNYQYNMCLIQRDLDKKSKIYNDFVMKRAAAITLITTFQISLTASGDDKGKFDSQLKELISHMLALADDMKPEKQPGHDVARPSGKPEPRGKNLLQVMTEEAFRETLEDARAETKTTPPAKKRNPADEAFKFAGIKPNQVTALLKERTK